MVVSEIKDLCLVAYEYINYENGKLSNTQYEVSRQISLLKKYAPIGIDIVHSQSITIDHITQHYLADTLKTFREESSFEMDGLVIIADVEYVRTTEGNPKHAIAFKTRGGDNVKEAQVTFVEWNVGKTGVFAPKVHIHPTEINGTTVSCFTGFNANYLMEKGIGKGAIILVTRVGDAIPQIIGVKKTGTLNFPKNYEWKGGCRIVEKITSKERAVKQILHFVERVEIPYIKEATIVKLYDNGCTTIKQFLKLTQKDLLMFGPKLSGTIYSNIQKSFEAPIEKVLSGFSAFGDYIGEKKIILLLKAYPQLFENDNLNSIDLLKIEGFGSKTVEQIKENFNYAKGVYVDITTNYPHKKEKNHENGVQQMKAVVSNIIVCISGTRDPLFIKELKDRNITLADSLTKKVHMLLVKTNDSQTSKVKKALELGTPIVTIEQFKVKYFL
jgi:NAD-dependent DNA ligase